MSIGLGRFQGFFEERELKDGGREKAVGVDWETRERWANQRVEGRRYFLFFFLGFVA